MRLPVSLKPSPVGKVAQLGRMRGRFIMTDHLRTAMVGSPLISQRAGPLTASPEGEAIQTKNRDADFGLHPCFYIVFTVRWTQA